MATEEQFNKAAEDVKNLNKKPSNHELLELYSLYKQATVGDCNTDKPGFLDLANKAKWEAWNGRAGTSKGDAMTAYVEMVNGLIQQYGVKA